MSAKPSAATTPEKTVKSKLFLAAIIVVVLAVLAVAAVLFLNARNQGGAAHASTPQAVVPVYLPLEHMVVNLADPGGDRFVQIGITLELLDQKTAKVVKEYLPSIRNGVLLLVSQSTSDELLTLEGKEKLAASIRTEVGRPLGLADAPALRVQPQDDYGYEQERPRRQPDSVRRVLFSSFIIQ